MAHNPIDHQQQQQQQQQHPAQPPPRASSPAIGAIGGRRKVVPSKPPSQPQPPSQPAVASNPAAPQSQPVSKPSASSEHKSSHRTDMYYGFEDISKLACRFISALFSCPPVPPNQSSTGSTSPQTPCPPLANFIAYAIHRTRLPETVVFTALFLLSRLKERFPAARGSSGHRLFISAFMIASKVICDDTYSNKSWCIVGQNLYSLKEVNQMEREMCSYLEWILYVDGPELKRFEQKVRKMYGPEAGANPPPWVSSATLLPPAPPAAPAPVEISSTIAPQVAQASYPSPASSPPTSLHSDDTSPASSVACLTPPSGDDQAAIASADGKVVKTVAPLDGSFAFAGPAVW